MGEPIVWDLLTKKVDDLTTIVEQIAADILTHNLDPSAHGQVDEAIEVHRTNDELDHIDGSISLKKLLSSSYLVFTCFEEIGNWQIAGNHLTNVFGAGLWTLDVVNDTSEALMWDVGTVKLMDFSKNPFFQTTVYFKQDTEQLAYFGCGRLSAAPTWDSFGFKIVDDTLYSWHTSNQVEFTTEIAGITLTDHNVFRAYIDSTKGELYFYVNGVLKVTVDSDLPTDSTEFMFFYSLKTTETERKYMRFCDLLLEVNR